MTYNELKSAEKAMMMQLSDDRFRPRAAELETLAILSEIRALIQPFEDRAREERLARTAMIAASMSVLNRQIGL